MYLVLQQFGIKGIKSHSAVAIFEDSLTLNLTLTLSRRKPSSEINICTFKA